VAVPAGAGAALREAAVLKTGGGMCGSANQPAALTGTAKFQTGSAIPPGCAAETRIREPMTAFADFLHAVTMNDDV
jgi:hypothetical protein